MVNPPSLIIEFYRERADDALAHIRYFARDAGEMGRIREAFPGDWEVEELTRHIVFLENQISQALMEEVSRDRNAIREHQGRALESPAGVCRA